MRILDHQRSGVEDEVGPEGDRQGPGCRALQRRWVALGGEQAPEPGEHAVPGAAAARRKPSPPPNLPRRRPENLQGTPRTATATRKVSSFSVDASALLWTGQSRLKHVTSPRNNLSCLQEIIASFRHKLSVDSKNHELLCSVRTVDQEILDKCS